MAINTSEVQPKVWKRYVDNSFCIIKRNAVNSFRTTFNSIDPHISFTIEEESDQQIAFLDNLVSLKDNTITISVFRKATHTDRYLDFSSHHDKRHKISTAETLLHRAIKLSSTSQGKNAEINHAALRVNNYPSYVISNILKRKFSKPSTHAIPTPEELVCMFLNGLHLKFCRPSLHQWCHATTNTNSPKARRSSCKNALKNFTTSISFSKIQTINMWFIKYLVPIVNGVI